MTEIDSRYIAFENDHTYLKTTYSCKEDVQLIQTKNSTVGPTMNSESVLSTTLSTTEYQNMENIHKTVNTLNVSNSDVLLDTDSLNFPSSNTNNISHNSLIIPKVNTRKKSIRSIQPKISNSTNIVSVSQTQLQNGMIPNKISMKSELPITPQENVLTKSIKPIKNKIVKDYENGTCTIKLSSNLLKRIQSGEKLFMCMECDKIYTKHKDLLDHQMIHDKFDRNIIVQDKERRENICVDNLKTIKAIKTEDIDDEYNFTKQSEPIFRSSVNPKKRKLIFQGECIMCHSVFPDLGKHLRTVHQNDLNKNKANNLKYHCYKCDLEFDIKQQLLAHEFSAHKQMYGYTCEHCFKYFNHKEDFQIHSETHFSETMKYLCPYCDAGFPYSNGLRTHLIKHIDLNYDNSDFEIPASQIEFSPTRPPEQLDQLFAELSNISEDDNEVYIARVTDDNYQVQYSKDEDMSLPLDSFVEKDHTIDLNLNKVKLEDNDTISINQQQTTLLSKKRISYTVCRICMVIVSYSRIGRHMKKKHNNAAPYQCEICHAEFNRKHIMDDHRRKHTNNKPHKCIECSKCFTYKHHLNRHMMIVHNADSLEKPFKCSVCDKAFSFKEYLTLHINSRHKGKHYMCQICGKSFSTNAALNKHQLCHTDERPFMCEHCGRTFKCKTHCDTHKKNMHPGDPQLALPPEKFECTLCNKKFSTKVYRDMHFKRHNGQGHQCDICYKLFVSKAHMQRHVKIMHQN